MQEISLYPDVAVQVVLEWLYGALYLSWIYWYLFYCCIKSLWRCSTFVAGRSMRLPTSFTRQSKLCTFCCTHLCVSLTPREFIVSILCFDLLGFLNCTVSSLSIEISIEVSWFLQMHKDYTSYRLNSTDYVSTIIRNSENFPDVGVGDNRTELQESCSPASDVSTKECFTWNIEKGSF